MLPSIPVRISVRGRRNAIVESIECLYSEVPSDLLGVFLHQWDYVAVEPIYETLERPIEERVKAIQVSTKREWIERTPTEIRTQNATYRARSTVASTTVPLDPACEVRCSATGIVYIAALPTLPGTALSVPHPFAVAENVRTVFAQYRIAGTEPRDVLSANVLAGAVITILHSLSLLSLGTTSIERANAYLANAGRATLSELLTHLLRISGTPSLPALSLADIHIEDTRLDGEGDANFVSQTPAAKRLRDYIRTCIGYSAAPIQRTQTKEKPKQTIRVYSDKARAEFKRSKEAKREGATLVTLLTKAHAPEHAAFLSELRNAVDAIAYLSISARGTLAARLEDTFKDDANAQKLAALLVSATTEHLSSDLLTFTQERDRELERELETASTVEGSPKRTRVNLLALLAPKA